jgi:signal transduction histidine kinase/CheY-like chemotaxis protein
MLRQIVSVNQQIATAETDGYFRTSNTVSRIVLMSSVLFSIILSYQMIRLFRKRIQLAEDGAKAIAQGNFKDLPEKESMDEISKIFESMSKVVTGLIAEINDAVRQNAEGNTGVRINADNFQGDLREAATVINELIDAVNESNVAKTRFLARMSHEIRTPMNAVLGITGIQLQKGNHPPQTEDAFLRIHNSSSLLLMIINDILDLSMVEAGKMEILSAPYETTSLIVDTVQLNKIHIGNKFIKFILNVSPKLPVTLTGDELRIKQIMNNLLSNAFKYTLEGTVTLDFDVKTTGNEATLIIKVTDTGQGMTDDQVDDLFNIEYTRYNKQSNRAIEGSGLGMTITYNLIKLMGGKIFVTSELGKGSCFTVHIPQKISSPEVLGEEIAKNLQKLESTRSSLKKLIEAPREPMPYGRVLVVDDVEVNLYVVEGIMESYQIKADTADSGPEAISKVKNGMEYDIIFMDHMMPGMDGVEAVAEIRALGCKTPIVALTANALKDSARMFTDNGFDGYISKPVDVNQIDKYMMKYVKKAD